MRVVCGAEGQMRRRGKQRETKGQVQGKDEEEEEGQHIDPRKAPQYIEDDPLPNGEMNTTEKGMKSYVQPTDLLEGLSPELPHVYSRSS